MGPKKRKPRLGKLMRATLEFVHQLPGRDSGCIALLVCPDKPEHGYKPISRAIAAGWVSAVGSRPRLNLQITSAGIEALKRGTT